MYESLRSFAPLGRARAPVPTQSHLYLSNFNLPLECFFIYYVRHLGRVAAVVPFQHIDESLNAAARHAFIWIGRQAGDARRAREMRQQIGRASGTLTVESS